MTTNAPTPEPKIGEHWYVKNAPYFGDPTVHLVQWTAEIEGKFEYGVIAPVLRVISHDEATALLAERDALKAENERLNKLLKTSDNEFLASEQENITLEEDFVRLEKEFTAARKTITELEEENARLRDGLSSIVHLQSACGRAAIREFAAELLHYADGKVTDFGGDQTPALKLLTEAKTANARLAKNAATLSEQARPVTAIKTVAPSHD